MYKIESLLSARLFLAPQIVGNRLYFVSNLSGRLSLYAMDSGGSIPEPLLPPDIALQNPELVGNLYQVFPKLGKILIMLDKDGNEDYKPMFIPLEGGYPEPVFGNQFDDYRIYLGGSYPEKSLIYFNAASHQKAWNITYRANLDTGELTELFASEHGTGGGNPNDDHTKVVLIEGYTSGDHVIYLWEKATGKTRLIYGTPLEQRAEGHQPEYNGIHSTHFIRNETALMFHTTVFEDTSGLGWFALDDPVVKPITMRGAVHTGIGEFDGLTHLTGNRYLAYYNIDGCNWVYEGTFDEDTLTFTHEKVLVGKGTLANGVLEHLHTELDSPNLRLPLSYSTATSPIQIYTIEGEDRATLVQHTRERLLGLPTALLSPGEDASFTSYDGLRISARMYLPAASLGFEGPRPLVYYIHGGPQSQERPDFAWFSMPLIQFLTLNGFAVFVPNVRGSSGYGFSYMKKVDRDWGGDDRLDHVHAMTQILPHDQRVDVSRAAVVGRSYGGYMTLTLAARHPELWTASCDMFGPYNLFTFMDRLPATWKPYFHLSVGHPEKDKDFLIERSPRTHIENVTAPMLVIQGKNDPRVIEQESRDLVEYLRSLGKEVEYLMFENEGHDVLKFENRVTCYNAITEFFRVHLKP
ncbi:MAG: S9 family peptidase [Anaerolineales bacterium]|nr:S9 family peptidase [Anaerolineales bacterium]